MRLSLTGSLAIARTTLYIILLDQETDYYPSNATYRSSDKNLTCGDGMNLDCYGVMATSGDFSMSIITLGGHYSMLS
jgi:hypothetical protein